MFTGHHPWELPAALVNYMYHVYCALFDVITKIQRNVMLCGISSAIYMYICIQNGLIKENKFKSLISNAGIICIYAPSQWETLHCNIVSHWLGATAYTKWSLMMKLWNSMHAWLHSHHCACWWLGTWWPIWGPHSCMGLALENIQAVLWKT